MSPKRFTLRSTLLFLLLAVLASLTFLLATTHKSPPHHLPPILLLPHSSPPPTQPLSLFERLVPATSSWAWLWRLKEVIRGKIRTVQIEANLLTLSNTTPLHLPQPDLETTASGEWPGLKIWLLRQEDLSSLRTVLRQAPGVSFVNSPRILTGDGIPTSLFTGETVLLNGITNEVGIKLSCLAGLYGELTDLTTFSTYSTTRTNRTGTGTNSASPDSISIVTNLDVKARFQIAKGKGIFLLQSSSGTNGPPQTAMIISTKL